MVEYVDKRQTVKGPSKQRGKRSDSSPLQSGGQSGAQPGAQPGALPGEYETKVMRAKKNNDRT